jgi:hypothetical protein
MLAPILQIFFGKEHLVCKNRLIASQDKIIYFKGTIFQRYLLPFTKLGEIS